MDVKEKEKKRKEKVINKKKKKCLCVLVIFCMLLNKKNEFYLYAQISKGQIKIMLYFP